MVYSGEDLRVFIPYEKIRIAKKIVVEPDKKAFMEKFGKEALRVIRMLNMIPGEEIVDSFRKGGNYGLKGDGKVYRITPEQVRIKEITVEEKGKRILPSVVEPSFGLDRLVYATLEYAYSEKEGRIVLRLPRKIAPIELAVFPLMSKDNLPEKAWEVYKMLVDEGFTVEYDESGSIGKRYARMDEAGTPIAITIDYQTLQDETVTLRDRDTWKQIRVKIKKLPSILRKYLNGEIGFDEIGEET